jgi:hypothetical protein
MNTLIFEDLITIYNKYKPVTSTETICFIYFEDDTFLPIITNEENIEYIKELYNKANIEIEVENTNIDYMNILGSSHEMYFVKMKIEDKFVFINGCLPVIVGRSLMESYNHNSKTIEKKELEDFLKIKHDIGHKATYRQQEYIPFTPSYIPNQPKDREVECGEVKYNFKPTCSLNAYNMDSNKYVMYNDDIKQPIETIFVLLQYDTYHTVTYVEPNEKELYIINNCKKYGFIQLLERKENQTNIQKIKKMYDNNQFSNKQEINASIDMIKHLKPYNENENIEEHNFINLINTYYIIDKESEAKLSDIYARIQLMNKKITIPQLCEYLKKMEIIKVRHEDGYYYGLKLRDYII